MIFVEPVLMSVVVQEWNKLPQEVVDATSVNEFKDRLDKF